jgi:hypothetical protein
MLSAAAGLTEVRTADLKKLLRAAHRGELDGPLDITTLTRHGLQHCAEPLLAMLRGLESEAIKAVTIVAIAERLPANKQRIAQRELGGG